MKRKHMNHIQDIIRRIQLGESERRIGRDMQISRQTVHKYHEIAKEQGYLEKGRAQPGEAELLEALGPGVRVPKQISTVEPYREKIQEWVKEGVEITAIWLRLKENYGYQGGYSSIRRFVHRLAGVEPEAFVRVHSEPGEDMQVDFGSVGQLYDPVTKRMRTAYVFVATLGYSRHQYAELVFDQKTATWIALHKRAFEYWGGVPQRVIPDNLKAAVLQALVHDPILGEAYRRLALHYGFLISPNIPHTPRHKGKVESGVHYVKRNFMAGQELSAHVSENFVEIYQGQKLVATHPHSTRPGQWQTRLEDYPPAKAAYLIRTPEYCKKLGAQIGPSTQSVVEQLLADRPLDRLRSVQAILKLEESVGSKRLEAACARATYFGDVRYRQIKNILNAALDREPLPETQPAQPTLSHVFARSGEEFFGSCA